MNAEQAQKMTVKELKEQLNQRGLPATGLKAVLLARLLEALEAEQKPGGPEVDKNEEPAPATDAEGSHPEEPASTEGGNAADSEGDETAEVEEAKPVEAEESKPVEEEQATPAEQEESKPDDEEPKPDEEELKDEQEQVQPMEEEAAPAEPEEAKPVEGETEADPSDVAPQQPSHSVLDETEKGEDLHMEELASSPAGDHRSRSRSSSKSRSRSRRDRSRSRSPRKESKSRSRSRSRGRRADSRRDDSRRDRSRRDDKSSAKSNEPCYSFRDSGRCRWGEDCKFSHDKSARDTRGDRYRSDRDRDRGSRYDRGDRYDRRDRYDRGDRYDRSDRRSDRGPCYDYRDSGRCRFGDSCRFSHDRGGNGFDRRDSGVGRDHYSRGGYETYDNSRNERNSYGGDRYRPESSSYARYDVGGDFEDRSRNRSDACYEYERSGRCKFGDTCRFRH